ncbi:lipopolysaccharide kinase InaA family protein [Methylophilus sp. OH31]|uniref:lipopolysaccharide kinase InaA family protein n=1 Tax=Methylophilus sp. OH31 TaxID=1387312 RepID=UPI000465432D|nr:lipopolysaccharide kinase InaA family protein [Methylophilus sp. OH31]
MLTRQVVVDGLKYIASGGFWLKNSHLPVLNHAIPDDFIGLCVASNADPATDDYVLEQLQTLGVKRVRLDISDDDARHDQERFLRRLLAVGVRVTLHVVQPYEAARNMRSSAVQAEWARFVSELLQAYATEIAALEIGNTVNRKKWAGYDMPGFMLAWQIAYDLARAHQVVVVGPNIQDFEPLYNISLLKTLGQDRRLPDVHSNNLFVERVVEPELADFRILKHKWTRSFKFNLIKKAKLLQKIGDDLGVPTLVSPVAFWAIFRIKRRFPDGAQKQADYVTRYFTLLAASGALRHANWGAFICHREGLIDDGLTDAEYPALERVAYYKSADGECADYQQTPGFAAFKMVSHWLNGAQYIAPVSTGEGLEIHHLQQRGYAVHIAWTVNGQCALLDQVYSPHSLQQAQIFNRDGELVPGMPLLTESPLYLVWPQAEQIVLRTTRPVLSGTVIHAHIAGQQYFPIQEGDWRGMILAANAEEAQQLWRAWHPETLSPPAKEAALRHARNAIWSLPDPRDTAQQVTVKKPVRMYWHKTLLDRYKPSKAKRSWNGAMELLRRGVGTAMPLAYFEHANDPTLKRNFFISAYVPHEFAISKAFLAFKNGDSHFEGIAAETLYHAFARFCLHMHSSGIYFRDFSGGNILVQRQSDGALHFVLIDTARLHASATAIMIKQRLADLTRALHKLHWDGRKQFLQMYLGMTGRRLGWQFLWPFYLYDFKVSLKKTIGRKGIRKLLRYIKSRFA